MSGSNTSSSSESSTATSSPTTSVPGEVATSSSLDYIDFSDKLMTSFVMGTYGIKNMIFKLLISNH